MAESAARPNAEQEAQMEFEQLNLDDMEAAMTMSVSDAMFTSVPSSYPMCAHIQCRCQVTNSSDLGPGCWIGLFKVGWSDANEDFVCKAECRPEAGNNALVAVFSQTQLPRDTADFYQFCFVAADGIVKGASTPFTFRPAPTEDFVAELDEEFQGVVVTARNAELQNELASLRLQQCRQRDEFEARNEELEMLRRKLESANSLLRQRTLINARLTARAEEADAAEAKANELTRVAEKMEGAVVAARMERDRLAEEVASLKEAQEEMGDRMKRLEAERLETQQRLEAERKAALEALEAERKAALEALEAEKLEAQRRLEAERKAALEALEAERLEAQRRLDVLEEEKRGESERAAALDERLQCALSDFESTRRSQTESLEAKDAECRALKDELAAWRNNGDEQLRQLRARSGSLRVAYETLKIRCLQAEERDRLTRQKYDEVIQLNREFIQREGELHAKIKDIRGRLSEGAKEYKKLMAVVGGCRQRQATCEEAADEFHDAASDEQSLREMASRQEEIYRPPMDASQELESASAAIGGDVQDEENEMEEEEKQQQPQAEPSLMSRVCPICDVLFDNEKQAELEQHVNRHFDD